MPKITILILKHSSTPSRVTCDDHAVSEHDDEEVELTDDCDRVVPANSWSFLCTSGLAER
jgi:hypothetical protein